MIAIVAFLAGFLFASGLVVSRMTRPGVVLDFLDVAGAWNPALVFVMAGAAGTFGLLYLTSVRRGRPILGGELRLPRTLAIDRRLVAGTAVFGVGWGLAGVCPGPAITSLASGTSSVAIFVAAMLAGIKVADAGGRQSRPASGRVSEYAEQ